MTEPRTRKRPAPRQPKSRLGGDDLHLFNEGTHYRLAEKLGAHPAAIGKRTGTQFAVWAPNAGAVSVIGDWNGWTHGADPLSAAGGSGIWEGFVGDVGPGATYKFAITSGTGEELEKADPFALYAELPPKTASVVWDLGYEWGDAEWMRTRAERSALDAPISIYELHLGSWRRNVEEGNRPLTYRELAGQLPAYAVENGFTHVELLPVMEHPYTGSWGYQTTGYFAPTSRYGTPQDFMALVDALHAAGVGVILDWVPSHFATDKHGLASFDGTHLFEHADPRQGFHPDWGSYIFNYGRNEVRSFRMSSALRGVDVYHADGLRVDAVVSMLYLDYSRKEGEWIPNQYGRRENQDAINFLRRFNTDVYQAHPDAQTVAEESTAWPMVSRPTYVGGLGFGMKWDMGWMHDMLEYMKQEPIYRKYHHNSLTFRMLYAFTENFVLPLSHDEVVHGKGSLVGKMPGDEWQRFANLRLLLGCMYAQPGKKLLFMGGEFGQVKEWNHDDSLEWHVLQYPSHSGLLKGSEDLNHIYRREPALYEIDSDPSGFEWIDCSDSDQSVLTFLRRGKSTGDLILSACNFTPVPRTNYRIGVPRGGYWEEIANSDAGQYWGGNWDNLGGVEASPVLHHGRPWSVSVVLPALSILLFKSKGQRR